MKFILIFLLTIRTLHKDDTNVEAQEFVLPKVMKVILKIPLLFLSNQLCKHTNYNIIECYLSYISVIYWCKENKLNAMYLMEIQVWCLPAHFYERNGLSI